MKDFNHIFVRKIGSDGEEHGAIGGGSVGRNGGCSEATDQGGDSRLRPDSVKCRQIQVMIIII
jgi:hypothetical protein